MYTLGNLAGLGVELGYRQGLRGNIDGRDVDRGQAGGHGDGDIPTSRADIEDLAARAQTEKPRRVSQCRLNYPLGIRARDQHPGPDSKRQRPELALASQVGDRLMRATA